MNYKPLFLCGTARGGTNLVKAALGVNNDIVLESEPFLPIYISLRDKIIKDNDNPSLSYIKPGSPLDEYYYLDAKLTAMEAIQNSSLNVDFDNLENQSLRSKITKRMNDYVPHLINNIDLIAGNNYGEIFDSALECINLSHNINSSKWLGWLDNWVIEFFPLLAKYYNNAHFIVIFRDVRGAIASMFSRADKNFKAPSTISFLRCWRKQVAFSAMMSESNLFNKRISFIKYENLVSDPEKEIAQLCSDLNIKYSSDMIDTKNFVGLGTNIKQWVPNSGYVDVPRTGIFNGSIERWRETLDETMISFIEFIAGPELKYLGYDLVNRDNYSKPKKRFYNIILEENNNSLGWRTDNNDAALDFSFEILRHFCLANNLDDLNIIKRFFLFPKIYNDLKGKKLF